MCLSCRARPSGNKNLGDFAGIIDAIGAGVGNIIVVDVSYRMSNFRMLKGIRHFFFG